MKKGTSNFWVSIAIFLLLQFSISFTAEGQQIVHGTIPPDIGKLGLQPIGSLDTTTQLNFGFSLPLQNQAALNNLLQQLYDPASPNYHQYLKQGQFTTQFGPSAQDYQAVIDFAIANGLTISRRSSSNIILNVKGTVAKVEKALNVKMYNYQVPNEARTFFAPDRDPSINLTVPIQNIFGLNNYSIPKPCNNNSKTKKNEVAGTGSGLNGSYKGIDFRKAYANGVTLTGSGQKLGLMELADFNNTDIYQYENSSGITPIPNVTIMKDSLGLHYYDQADSVEATLDIEMAVAMAPGLSEIKVYEDNNFRNILDQMAEEDSCMTLSTSCGSSSVGGDDPTSEVLFQKMAAQGQSFFSASGDWGAYGSGNSSMGFPYGSPYITIVGGTELTTTGPGGYICIRNCFG